MCTTKNLRKNTLFAKCRPLPNSAVHRSNDHYRVAYLRAHTVFMLKIPLNKSPKKIVILGDVQPTYRYLANFNYKHINDNKTLCTK